MKEQAVFDIYDNDLISGYLHFPITRNHQFWDKSMVELYEFTISRVRRGHMDISKESLEHLLLKMSFDNGPLCLYLPFNKNILNSYLQSYRQWIEARGEREIENKDNQESFVNCFNEALSTGGPVGDNVKTTCDTKTQSKWPFLIMPIINSLLADLKVVEHNLDDNMAWALIGVILEEMSNICGGRAIYLCSNQKIRVVIRDTLIFDEFNGSNIVELTKKYRVSPQRAYEAIRNQRKYRFKQVS